MNHRPLQNDIAVSRSAGPKRVVVDASGTPSAEGTFRGYAEQRMGAHFTLVPATREVFSHVSLDKAVVVDRLSIGEPTRIGTTIWVMVAKESGTSLDQEASAWVGSKVCEIAQKVGAPCAIAPFPAPMPPDPLGAAMSFDQWETFSGICAAISVPGVQRFGPGVIDVAAFSDAFTVEPAIKKFVWSGKPVVFGSKGKRVVVLQEMLGLEATGTFDEALEIAVNEAKGAVGMDTDGMVDKATWDALVGS